MEDNLKCSVCINGAKYTYNGKLLCYAHWLAYRQKIGVVK